MTFSDNTADVGPVVYIDKLNLCSWNSNQSPYFDIERAFRWRFVELKYVCSISFIIYSW